MRITVEDHLLVPFGRPKWDIQKIKVKAVTTRATYFESETPCAYINVIAKQPLRLRDIRTLFPERLPEDIDDAGQSLNWIRKWLGEMCVLDTPFEGRFLDLYFQHCKESVTPHWLTQEAIKDIKKRRVLKRPYDNDDWVFESLMPLPQAHLYCHNPFGDDTEYPSTMYKVDFAFWTGSQFVAVEIDGSSHIGDEHHVIKDRLLQRAGVLVIHILNDELVRHGTRVIKQLLPEPITCFWQSSTHDHPDNPLSPFFGMPPF